MERFRRIFAIVPDVHVTRGYYAPLWREHFYQGLRECVQEVGVPAVDFDWARDPAASVEARGQAKAEAMASLRGQFETFRRQGPVDAVISYCYSADLDLAWVREVGAAGIPWVNFFCDSLHRFEEVRALAACTSLNWHVEAGATPSYAALNVPAICLPYALHPAALPDLSSTVAVEGPCFVGMPTGPRVHQLAELRRRGHRVAIRGFGWNADAQKASPATSRPSLRRFLAGPGKWQKILWQWRWRTLQSQSGPELPHQTLYTFLGSHKVVLGLNESWDSQRRNCRYLKFRDLEFPACGLAYLTGRCEDTARALAGCEAVHLYEDMQDAARVLADEDAVARLQAARLETRRILLARNNWATRLGELAEACP